MRTIVIPRTAIAGIADCLTMTAALSTDAKLRTKTIPTNTRRTRMTALPFFKACCMMLLIRERSVCNERGRSQIQPG